MFGKRQSFGGNTPGAATPPRPVGSPSSTSAAQVVRSETPPRPVVDAAVNRLRSETIEMRKVRSGSGV